MERGWMDEMEEFGVGWVIVNKELLTKQLNCDSLRVWMERDLGNVEGLRLLEDNGYYLVYEVVDSN